MINKMKKFGQIKETILENMVNFYTNDKKNELSELIQQINEDKKFKELYVLYEDIEDIYFDNKDSAKYFVDELSNSLKGKYALVNETCKKISRKYNSNEYKNELYKNLDVLLEEDSISTIKKKLNAKIDLIEYFLKNKKTEKISESLKPTVNNKLLMSLLVSNYNTVYDITLSEEEKQELKKIINEVNHSNIESKVNELKEELLNQINKNLQEEKNEELIEKFKIVKEEISNITPSRYNYYKLNSLKNGLN